MGSVMVIMRTSLGCNPSRRKPWRGRQDGDGQPADRGLRSPLGGRQGAIGGGKWTLRLRFWVLGRGPAAHLAPGPATSKIKSGNLVTRRFLEAARREKSKNRSGASGALEVDDGAARPRPLRRLSGRSARYGWRSDSAIDRGAGAAGARYEANVRSSGKVFPPNGTRCSLREVQMSKCETKYHRMAALLLLTPQNGSTSDV